MSKLSEEKEHVRIPVRFHKVDEKDLLDFLEDKPKAWIMKEALRLYKERYEALEQGIVQPNAQPQYIERAAAPNVSQKQPKMNFGDEDETESL